MVRKRIRPNDADGSDGFEMETREGRERAGGIEIETGEGRERARGGEDGPIVRKRGRPKKSEVPEMTLEASPEQLKSVGGMQSSPPEEKSVEKLKRKRGRPKKLSVDEHRREAPEVKQTSPPPGEEEPLYDGTVTLKRGQWKNVGSDGEAFVMPATDGRKNTPFSGKEQLMDNEEIRDTRCMFKKTEGGRLDFLAAESGRHNAATSEKEKPGDDTISVKRGKLKISDDKREDLSGEFGRRQITNRLGEDFVSPKRNRGRPKKLEDYSHQLDEGHGRRKSVSPGEQLMYDEQKRRQITKRLAEQFGATKRKRGRPKKLDVHRHQLEEIQGRQSSVSPGEQLLDDAQTRRSIPDESESNKVESAPVDGRQSPQSLGGQPVAAILRRKRGRPKKLPHSAQDLVATKEMLTTPPEVHVIDEEQNRSRGGPDDSENNRKELEIFFGRQSIPATEEQPADRKQRRKRGRPRKAEINNQGTTSERRQQLTPELQLREDTLTCGLNEMPNPLSGQSSASNQSKSAPAINALGKASKSSATSMAKRHYLTKIELDGVLFQVGDDVYVKKSDGAGSESDTEVEDCRICGIADECTMLECDCCLAGYHLTCLNPPLEIVPEGDWMCHYCANGGNPPESANSRRRPFRERLLTGDLWAARIERIWREADGAHWFSAHWFVVPEETIVGRQPHTGRRELFRYYRSDDNEIFSILRHCYVMSPQEYKNCGGEGDDVFYCGYEYNEKLGKLKRIEYPDVHEKNAKDGHEEPIGLFDDHQEGSEGQKRRPSIEGKRLQQSKGKIAANKRPHYSHGNDESGTKSISHGDWKQPQTIFERAKAAFALSAVPPTFPCRDREREEISAFLTNSLAAGEHCSGQCLYISGVPGMGKTATVLEVIKELDRKVVMGELSPYRFVEINGLHLPSPEFAYTILYEALTGQHLGWTKALQYLEDRFSKGGLLKGLDARPCVLLVDELDLLETGNRSVLYNIFDWPSRPQSRLIIIGIANTMDLPERTLPQLGHRMDMRRISFVPYSHKQLEEIISARFKGLQVFEEQATELMSRKVAAVSGDVRQALEICRRAVDVAEARLETPSSGLPSSAWCDLSSSAVKGTTLRMADLRTTGGSITTADVDLAILTYLRSLKSRS